ncbi:MAG: family 20 glycosylhydrolase [Sphaerochaetaceae bacterium]|jgi:hexosaminidase|nr:family 20 glycosylhydrolase [Sphaerochaetaceae bacterium]MDD3163604.1 family 20 glycosylhydrolase [Sphaerochaetaceae bacterium]MDD4396880.1 family 20 glycosylhydrolase [Sphaerochaetaceae bacterium]
MIPEVNGTIKRGEGLFHLPSKEISCFGPKPQIMVFCSRINRKPLFCEESGEAELSVNIVPKGLHSGSYSLSIEKKKINVEAQDIEGVSNGLVTLFWLLDSGNGSCQCQSLLDCPDCDYRGFMIDSCRHFLPAEQVMEMIEQCSLRKMNRLHWHLSDDQGYRIESSSFPALNKTGSWRKEPDGTVYGGFYTQKEIRCIVDFAKARGMEIIPEIDMPGHTSAMIAAYPDLGCSSEKIDVPFLPGIFVDILCAGKDEVISFVKHLLDEVCLLFPYEYFHLGGDEAPKEHWKNCGQCQQRIKKEKLSDEEALQSWFMRQAIDHLTSKGKKCIEWNEALEADSTPDDVLIQYWEEDPAKLGYCDEIALGERKCIYSLRPVFYLDFIPGIVPLRDIFFSQNKLQDGKPVPPRNIAGYEACFWSERLMDKNSLFQHAFPRIFAIAAKGWHNGNDYSHFVSLCREELKWMDANGIPHLSIEESDPEGEVRVKAVIDEYRKIMSYFKENGQPEVAEEIREAVPRKYGKGMKPEEVRAIRNGLMD